MMIQYKQWRNLYDNLKLSRPGILSDQAWRKIHRDINMEFWGVMFFNHDLFP